MNKKPFMAVSNNEFESEWESTGHMIKETPISFVQTYSHYSLPGRKFKQIGGSIGEVHLEEVKD